MKEIISAVSHFSDIIRPSTKIFMIKAHSDESFEIAQYKAYASRNQPITYLSQKTCTSAWRNADFSVAIGKVHDDWLSHDRLECSGGTGRNGWQSNKRGRRCDFARSPRFRIISDRFRLVVDNTSCALCRWPSNRADKRRQRDVRDG